MMKRSVLATALTVWMTVGVAELSATSRAGAAAEAPPLSMETKNTASNEEASKKERQRLYLEYLKAEGYLPTIDSDGDIVFKREGLSYLIIVQASDPSFFRVVLPNIWEIENAQERSAVLEAANASNASTKVSKIYIVKNRVWASIEQFVPHPEAFKESFKRALRAMDTGTEEFIASMRRSTQAGETNSGACPSPQPTQLLDASSPL